MDAFEVERKRMVANQIARRGISDARVLTAMRQVPRHRFLPEESWSHAYDDSPVRIGSGQTMSQPYIVALMTELLGVAPGHRVLDVGTGSGYQAAILGELAQEVYSIERHSALAETAASRLAELGYQNVQVHVGDGSLGYPPAAPYDRILVAAAAPEVPLALQDQLTDGGRLVVPVGEKRRQQLEVWEREGETFRRTNSIPVVFVPLIGEQGWEG